MQIVFIYIYTIASLIFLSAC